MDVMDESLPGRLRRSFHDRLKSKACRRAFVPDNPRRLLTIWNAKDYLVRAFSPTTRVATVIIESVVTPFIVNAPQEDRE